MRFFRILLVPTLLFAAFAHPYAQTAPAKMSISEKIAADQNKLDLNTATAAELRALPGMGDAYVKRIVEGRPYTAKNQLIRRGILPEAAYDQIKDQIIAHRPKKQ